MVLSLLITEEAEGSHDIPEQLVKLEPYEPYKDQGATHTYILGRNTINGKQMDMMGTFRVIE